MVRVFHDWRTYLTTFWSRLIRRCKVGTSLSVSLLAQTQSQTKGHACASHNIDTNSSNSVISLRHFYVGYSFHLLHNCVIVDKNVTDEVSSICRPLLAGLPLKEPPEQFPFFIISSCLSEEHIAMILWVGVSGLSSLSLYPRRLKLALAS